MSCVVSGDILIFMPGQEDIEVTCDLIAGIFVICIFIVLIFLYIELFYIILVDTTTPPQPFYGPFSGTTQVSRCQNRTTRLYGAGED